MQSGLSLNAQSVSGYLGELVRLLKQVVVTDHEQVALSIDAAADRVVELLATASGSDTKVMLIGNGGSAAIASHLHNDLCKAVGVRALVFNEHPLLMALANDEGYGSVFERPINLWADEGDVLIAISSSGSSENVLRGAQRALAAGATLITLSGFQPTNPLRKLGHLNFYVPSSHYGMVEQTHSILTHYFSDAARFSVQSRATREHVDGRELLVT